MNLCDRLQAPSAYGSLQKYLFRYRGEIHAGKHELIRQIVERFSLRFGEITGAQADALYRRLADKYGTYPGSLSTFKALELGHAASHRIAHPQKLGRIGKEVEFETRIASGWYCLIDSAQKPCRVCGRPTTHQIANWSKTRTVSASRDGLCLHTRCQALAALFPQAFKSRKYYQFPLILVLQDLKNDHDENQRRLEEHFVRHARQIHQRRDRCRDGKDGGKNC
jgi:hypothetical protein